TGTDGTGDYVTVTLANRGLGGTSDIAHLATEKVRMNFTAEHQQETSDQIDAIVAAGAADASTTTKGIAKMSTTPATASNPIAVGDNDARLNATTGLTADEEGAIGGAGEAPTATNQFLTEGDIDDEALFTSPTVETFTASGTWTKDAGLKYIIVESVGGGGGGGIALDNGGGSGGGGGGYCRELILASSLGATETVTVGTGGATDVAGVDTTFGAHFTAGGGGAGADETDGGAGGTATGGDVNIPGEIGERSSADTISYKGGNGGASVLGFGGDYGRAGGNYGGGGSGGFTSGSTDDNGGAGAPGIVIVTEYYS
ncbi:hypothetical protein KAU11_10995, partial [Candidatus Babeliales bacterium]|nr:hypothetical protein [Candidatus Babeliales bacterium]